MASTQRPFDPGTLKRYAVPAIRAQLGPETLVRRFTIFLPMEEVKDGRSARIIATTQDLLKLCKQLAKDFGGVTMATTVPSLLGWGARDARRPTKTQELNQHAFFTVYAAAVRASDEYFLALQRELAEALVEGIILIERQDVTIL